MSSATITSEEFAHQYARTMSWLPAAPAATVPSESDFSHAVMEWSVAIGSEFVLTDNTTLDRYSHTTLPQGTTPLAVLRPSTTAEVRQVVSIAAKYGIKWHVISRGKNWGYGDACAESDGQVIVELKRLNRIREVNQELAYAVIEAGVSQGQLYQFLRERRLPLMMDVTGAGPDASIVGNILQRGFGHTPYGDRIQHCARMEVVLPTGELLYTGFGNDAKAGAAHVYKWGIGPSVDGLFAQSNLGIVTAITLWLMPSPETVEAFCVELQDDTALCRTVSILRDLKLQGLLSSTIHIANDHRVQQHSRADGVNARIDGAIAQWNVCGGIYGNRLLTTTVAQILRRDLRGVGRLWFFNAKSLRWGKRLSPFLCWLAYGRYVLAKVNVLETVYSLLNGEPTGQHLSAFVTERNESPPSTGLMWISPVIPASTDALLSALAVVRNTFVEFRFPPQITITFINPRALIMVMSISFDKHDIDETNRASKCARVLRDRLFDIDIRCYRRASVAQCGGSSANAGWQRSESRELDLRPE